MYAIEQLQTICASLDSQDAIQFMPSDDEISAAEDLLAVLFSS